MHELETKLPEIPDREAFDFLQWVATKKPELAKCELCARKVLPCFIWQVRLTTIILRDGEETPCVGYQSICVKCLKAARKQGLKSEAIRNVVEVEYGYSGKILAFPSDRIMNL